MSDPAIDAAEQVWALWCADGEVLTEPGSNGTTTDLMRAAARKVLAPLKELHRPVKYHPARKPVCHTCWDVDGDYHRWPCPTAKLIYPESELT